MVPHIPKEFLPRHVALTPDGNGRWAKRRGLPRGSGHRQGARALQEVVGDLMGVYAAYLKENKEEMRDLGVRVRWLGAQEGLPDFLLREIESAENITRDRDALTLVLCLNYGGRDEILRAVNRVAEDARNGVLADTPVDEKLFAGYLNELALPDVDLYLRPGGETRTSNFFLWQMPFAEMVFTETPWPDMTRKDLWEAVERYTLRKRRLGGLG
ncbi:polyprenyl diphosphate synthase [Streptomyces acidiscabies]|uniref:Polyprenyl diphosphate synthase n=1 Tax=Streptomyces acidiscabies TaxID=42234 RepID=A0AAP6BKM7_9ACTN|nr:polyprenyl diphosphate synthase [Streptomyces acidiscabies]MBP5942149.1 di-trans,poly-cis-decaprenylcistransferase [Streptomyces sp. LBUM 1476]MBZ3913663.1 di-trans,poly-cis-decaprenylcistransferase [Streptomyces acidiscabies]MDX2966493.1 polyprenyl diphosphate synthase [Streptomyces acidiscabies]MDX3025864.1 polyprenyl diphosphate synthase [Streptomyces acidiscabies]MDX3796446.1 polyprenyl diphosphate synthase [Streptomyces acidiscabies]